MRSFVSKTLAVFVAILLLSSTVLVVGCSSGRSSRSTQSYSARPNDGHIHEYNHRLSDDSYVCALCGYVYEGDPDNLVEGTPDMDNAIRETNNASIGQNSGIDANKRSTGGAINLQWPTKNPDLLAIPEEQRWYNGWAVAGTNCTLVGPVVNVYQAQDEAGAPIFINLGASYPNTDGVTLLIWGDQYYDFADMINAVDDGGAWLSVSGYLSVYNDHLQFDAGEGYVEYTWWTPAS